MDAEKERYAKRRAELDRRGKALDARQHRDTFWIKVLTVALGLVAAVAVVAAAWYMMRNWTR
jgi:hypothetical protein